MPRGILCLGLRGLVCSDILVLVLFHLMLNREEKQDQTLISYIKIDLHFAHKLYTTSQVPMRKNIKKWFRRKDGKVKRRRKHHKEWMNRLKRREKERWKKCRGDEDVEEWRWCFWHSQIWSSLRQEGPDCLISQLTIFHPCVWTFTQPLLNYKHLNISLASDTQSISLLLNLFILHTCNKWNTGCNYYSKNMSGCMSAVL